MKFILLSSLCLFAIAVAGHRYGIEYYSEKDSKGVLNQKAFEGDGCQNLNFGSKSYEMKKLDDNHCCAFFHDYGCAPDQFVFASESKKQDTPNGIKSIQCKEKSCDDLEDDIKSKDRSTTSSSTSSKTSSEESSTTERRRSTSSDESSTTSRRRSTPSDESSTTEESTSTMSTTFSTLTRKSTTTTDSDTTTKETSTSTSKQAKETESAKFDPHIKICPRKGQEGKCQEILPRADTCHSYRFPGANKKEIERYQLENACCTFYKTENCEEKLFDTSQFISMLPDRGSVDEKMEDSSNSLNCVKNSCTA